MSTLMPDTLDTPQFNGLRPTWLWPLRIPFGKITLLAGDPGLGKSFIALDIAARLSTGSPMPQGLPTPPSPGIAISGPTPPPLETGNPKLETPQDTLLLSAEDELHDTILPRLRALHADTSRIHPFRCLDACRQSYEPFSLKTHLDELSLEIEFTSAQLLIFDPITAFMDGIDINSTSHVRQYLTPLAQMAAFYNVAVLAITHLNKRISNQSLHRATGSLALAAASRTVHLVHPSPSLKHNLFSPIKQNLNTPQPPLPFTIANNSLEWLDPALYNSDSEKANPNAPDIYEFHDRQFAIEFLQDALKDGPKPAAFLFKEARKLAVSEKTLKRAKTQLGIISQKIGRTEWHWTVPGRPPPFSA